MQSIKPLDELTPEDLWREVPSVEDELWQSTREYQRRLVKAVLEGLLEREMTELLGAARFRRVESRSGYRNGFYERDLVTQIGIVTAIRVPRARGKAVERTVFHRYQRRQTLVNQVIKETFLAGVSTRRVGETLKGFLGEGVSAQTVSRIARELDTEVERFHRMPVADDIKYLILDGVYLRVKGLLAAESGLAGARRRLVLCAYGVSTTGERRLLDFRLAPSESAAHWEAFLNQLRERGLLGQSLKLIVTDGCTGLHSALDVVYPYVPRQHCWVHKLRNVASYLKRAQQKQCLAGAKAVYQAETKKAAVQTYWAWARRWRAEAPKAVACLERDLETLLAFLSCPNEHRRMVRTTNAIERCFREVRRRTRPMTCFNNDASCERIIYAVFSHLNENWKGKPLPQFTHNS
jgi:putative transposase